MMLNREQCEASTASPPPASLASNLASSALHQLSPRTPPSKPPSSLQIAKIKTADTITTIANPKSTTYNNHNPYQLRISATTMKRGFYKQLTSLQGQENTRWTGAAFDQHDSGALWASTSGFLNSIAAECDLPRGDVSQCRCRVVAVGPPGSRFLAHPRIPLANNEGVSVYFNSASPVPLQVAQRASPSHVWISKISNSPP